MVEYIIKYRFFFVFSTFASWMFATKKQNHVVFVWIINRKRQRQLINLNLNSECYSFADQAHKRRLRSVSIGIQEKEKLK